MASNVAQPLERQFSLIAGVTQMTSTSVLGSTQITLQFDLNRNIDAAALDVQAAINAAGGQLPTNLPRRRPFARSTRPIRPIMILAVQSDTLPLTEVNDYADNILAQQISQITGRRPGQSSAASRSRRCGSRSTRPSSPALGLSLDDVRGVLATATVNAAQGQHRRRATRASPSTPTISAGGGRAANDVMVGYQTARRSGCATSAQAVRRRTEDVQSCAALARTTSRPCILLVIQAAGRQRHRDGRSDQGRAAAAAGRHPARRSTSTPSSTARRPSAPRCTTSSSRWCSPSAWWCW